MTRLRSRRFDKAESFSGYMREGSIVVTWSRWAGVKGYGARKAGKKPGATNWIDARKAFFVIESRKQGGMGAAEAVPFGNRESADAFAAANGGKVVTFAQIPGAYVLGSDTPGNQTERDRSDVRLN